MLTDARKKVVTREAIVLRINRRLYDLPRREHGEDPARDLLPALRIRRT